MSRCIVYREVQPQPPRLVTLVRNLPSPNALADTGLTDAQLLRSLRHGQLVQAVARLTDIITVRRAALLPAVTPRVHTLPERRSQRREKPFSRFRMDLESG